MYSLSLSKHPYGLLRAFSFLILIKMEVGWYDLGVIFTFQYLNFYFAVGCESSPPPL